MKKSFFALALLPGLANGDLLMKIAGIDGEATDREFKGWIDVLSLGMQGHLGSSDGKVKGAAGSLVVSKSVDSASLPLKVGLVKGQIFSDMTIIMRREEAEGQKVFAKLDFRDVRVVTSSEEGPFENNLPLEQVTLVFRQVFYSYVASSGEKTSTYVKSDDELDTDSDGMPDSFEEFYGFDKSVADGDKDTDKDGFTDLEEFKLGLNPRSAASIFRLNALKKPEVGGGVKLSWKSKPGMVYRILVSPSLDQPFQPFRTVTAEELEEEVDLGDLGLRGFYRIETVSE